MTSLLKEFIMISVRLPKDMEMKLENMAKLTHRTKSFYVKEAIANYLEDMEDYLEVLKRKNDKKRNLITLEELEEALEL
jgi:RHH-type rel operon transcriptional repressor/antitoxin RelB